MNLEHRRILLVEDEYMLARDMKNELRDVGAVVLGPEGSVAQALQRVTAEPKIDAAVLDVNLGGEMSFQVADALQARRVPFVFSTGYEDTVTQDRYPGVAKCDKPLDMHALMKVLQELIAGQQTESAVR